MADNRKDIPPPGSPNFDARVRETLSVMLGARGDRLDRVVTLRDLVDSGMVTLRPGYETYGGDSPVSGPGTGIPTGGSNTPDEPDLTPPPQPTGVALTATFSNIIIQTDTPGFTMGHGYGRTKVYGAKYSGTGNLPTFANAVLVHEFVGSVGRLSTELGTEWHLWLKWQTQDGVESVSPSGGTNGDAATTGKIGNTDLGDLIITADKIANGEISAAKLAAGAIEATKFANGIEPVTIVTGSVVPTTKSTNTIFLTGTGKMYRWTGTAYTAAVATADLSGTISDAQIAGLAAAKVTGQLTDAQLAAISAAKVTGTITASQIADGSVSGTKFASGIEPLTIVTGTLPTTKSTSTIFRTDDSKTYRWNGTAYVATVATTDLTGTVTDAQIAGLAASKVTGQLTNTQIADVAAAKLTGQVVASQIADATLTTAKFASGIEPLAVVTSVPGAKTTSTIFNSTDAKLYRWNGTAYVASIPAADLSGTIADAQIAGLAASKVTGQLTDSQLAAISAAKLTGTITGTQIANGAISGTKFASGIEPLTIVTGTLPTTKSTSAIYRTDDSKVYRWNGTAYTAAIPTSDLSGTIADAQIAGMAASKVTGQLTNAQIADLAATKLSGTLTDAQLSAISAAKITGTIVASQIADASLTTTKFASGIEPISIIGGTVLPTTKSTNAILLTGTGKIYRWMGGGYSSVVDTYELSGTISDAQIAGMAASKVTGQLSDSQLSTISAAKLTGQITGTQITDNAITTAKIAAGAVTAANIAADTITASQIASNAITSAELAAGAVVAGKIAAGTIQAADIAAGAVVAGKIAAGAVTATELSTGAVTAGKIAAGAVSATEIAAGAVTTSKLLVTGQGAALNDDPACQDPSAWAYDGPTGYPGLWGSPITQGASAGGSAEGSTFFDSNVSGPTDQKILSRLVPINPARTYSATAMLYAAAGNARNMYIIVDLYDGAGAQVGTTWGGAYSGYTFGGQPPVGDWTRQGGQFGAGTSRPIPATAKTARIGVWFHYSTGTGFARQAAQAIRLQEVAGADLIVDGAITAAKIQAGAISTDKLAANAVTANEIAANAVTATQLAAGAVTAGKIAANAVTANEIAASTITGAKIAAGTVTSSNIAAGAIQASNIAAEAVTVGKIAAGAVTATELSAGAVTAGKIAAGAVSATELSAGAVTTAKIAAGAVTASQIAADTITAANIAASAITSSELAAGAVVAGKIAAGTIQAADVAAGSITGDRLAANTITAAQIAGNTITAGQIAAGAIGAGQIAAGAISTDKLLVTGQGAALNDDPYCQDLTAWADGPGGPLLSANGNASIVSDSTCPAGGKSMRLTTPFNVASKRIPIDPNRNYQFRIWTKQESGTSTAYLTVYFFDASGNVVNATGRSGWGAEGTYNYFGLVGSTPPTSWTEYSIRFGPQQPAGIPTNAVSCCVGVLTNYSGTGVQRYAGIRMMECASADLIVDGAITASKVAAASITGDRLAANTVTAAQIAASTITATEIASGTITSAKIAAGAIGASQIAAGAITTQKLLVHPVSICPDPFFSDQAWWSASQFDTAGWYYENGSFLSAPFRVSLWSGHPTNNPGSNRKHIWSGNVTSPPVGTVLRLRARMANGSNQNFYVVARFYDSGGTGVADIVLTSAAGGGVIEDKTAQQAVPANAATIRFIIFNEANNTLSGFCTVTGIMLDVAASADLIVDGAITASKIAANTITAGQIAAGAIGASQIAAASITGDRLAANTITASQIASATITSANIAADTITAANIAASAITSTELAAGAVVAGKIAAGTIQAADIAAGTITGDRIAGNTVSADKLVANSITAGQIAAGAIGASQIAAGAITTSKLLVTGQGKSINPDPTFADASAWQSSGTGSYTLSGDSTSPGAGRIARANGSANFETSSMYPVEGGKQYKVSMWARKPTGTGLLYIRLYCYDNSNSLQNYIVTAISPATGSFEGLTTATVGAAWQKYTGYIVAAATATRARLVIHANWTGDGYTDIADFRFEEYIGSDLIVDGAITATKMAAGAIAVGSAAIANGAIRRALIEDLAVDSAKIADAAIVTAKIGDAQITTAKIGDAQITNAKITALDAGKITTGTLDAGRIAAGSITANKINGAGLNIYKSDGVTPVLIANDSSPPWVTKDPTPAAGSVSLVGGTAVATNAAYIKGLVAGSGIEYSSTDESVSIAARASERDNAAMGYAVLVSGAATSVAGTSVSLEANSTYRVAAVVRVSASATTATPILGLSLPAGCAGSGVIKLNVNNAASDESRVLNWTSGGAATATFSAMTVTGYATATIEAVFTTSSAGSASLLGGTGVSSVTIGTASSVFAHRMGRVSVASAPTLTAGSMPATYQRTVSVTGVSATSTITLTFTALGAWSASTVSSGTPVSGTWLSSTGAGFGNSWEVLFVVSQGSVSGNGQVFSQNSAANWTSMSADRTVSGTVRGYDDFGAFATVTVNIYFRPAGSSGGGTLWDTVALELAAFASPLGGQ